MASPRYPTLGPDASPQAIRLLEEMKRLNMSSTMLCAMSHVGQNAVTAIWRGAHMSEQQAQKFAPVLQVNPMYLLYGPPHPRELGVEPEAVLTPAAILEFKPRNEGTITLTNEEALCLFQAANVVRSILDAMPRELPEESFEGFITAGLKLHAHLGKAGYLSCCKEH